MTQIIPIVGANFADNTMPVLANDSLARVGSQAIFDFANPSCWGGGSPGPSDTATNLMSLPTLTGVFRTSQPSYANGLMTFSGAAGSADAIEIQNTAASGVPFYPPGDGDYRDMLVIVWVKAVAFPASNAGVWGFGRSGGAYVGPGLQVTSSGLLQNKLSGVTTGITLSAGVMVQVGLHFEYDEAGGTSSITSFRNGAAVSTVTGPDPMTLTQDANSKAYLGGAAGNSNGLNGSIGRFVVEYTSVSGLNATERVAADFDAYHARFGI